MSDVRAVVFRMGWSDGLAHVTPKGYATSLCGARTRQAAPERGVPCGRCLERQGERVADAEAA